MPRTPVGLSLSWTNFMADPDPKTSFVLATLTGLFAVMAAGFVFAAWRNPPPARVPHIRAEAPSPGPIRISAAELRRSGGDTSGLDCYACHDEKKPPEVTYGPNGRIVLPKEHADLIFAMRNCASCHGASTKLKVDYTADGMVIIPDAHQDLREVAHGRSNRNDACYNCHNPAKLDQLVTRDGTKLKLEEATALCASCHGPSFRDWEAGVHGRTSGFWSREMGPSSREECASCHDPHAPAFPQLIPRPGPRPLRERATSP
jgi:predicted CXXCH cytochrome family protein